MSIDRSIRDSMSKIRLIRRAVLRLSIFTHVDPLLSYVLEHSLALYIPTSKEIFPHAEIHAETCISACGNTHNTV